MDNNNEYIPYGEEWVKEMMKFPKPLLIEKLSAALQSVTLVEEKEPEGNFTELCEEGQNLIWLLLPAHKYQGNKDAGRLWEILDTIKNSKQ